MAQAPKACQGSRHSAPDPGGFEAQNRAWCLLPLLKRTFSWQRRVGLALNFVRKERERRRPAAAQFRQPQAMGVQVLYFTICARNYLAYARTLHDSLKAVEPDAAFIVFLSDAAEGVDIPGLQVVGMEALGIANLDDLAFRYSVLELSTAIKPFCFCYAFDVLKYQEAVFLDPDIAFFAPPAEVRSAFDAGASGVLTPHLLEPLDATLASGAFNLGCAGFANQPEARRFLDWWGRQLRVSCSVDATTLRP
jgi:hypothetical protein